MGPKKVRKLKPMKCKSGEPNLHKSTLNNDTDDLQTDHETIVSDALVSCSCLSTRESVHDLSNSNLAANVAQNSRHGMRQLSFPAPIIVAMVNQAPSVH